MKRRVVVTGIDAFTPIGSEKDKILRNLKEGVSGVDYLSLSKEVDLPVKIGGEVKDFSPEDYLSKKEIKRLDRFCTMSLINGMRAFEDSGLKASEYDHDRLGVVYGSGIAGVNTLLEDHKKMLESGWQSVGPFHVPKIVANEAPGNISIKIGATGPNKTPVVACATGTIAIGDSFHMIRDSYADMVVCGACESALNPLSLAGFHVINALADEKLYDSPEHASRPFDKNRSGFVIAEGAGAVVLEELEHAKARNARIYAEVLGYGMSADAYHITAPDPEGKGACKCMKWAVMDAGLELEDINYINAHGTSTPFNDSIETKAIKDLFGQKAYKIPVNSTKSMVGHMLGAAGAFEFIATVLQINHNFLHPTINHEVRDPECDLDYVPNRSRDYKINCALSNSFGFGGQNSSLVIKRYEG